MSTQFVRKIGEIVLKPLATKLPTVDNQAYTFLRSLAGDLRKTGNVEFILHRSCRLRRTIAAAKEPHFSEKPYLIPKWLLMLGYLQKLDAQKGRIS
jgi:hypothetical protein